MSRGKIKSRNIRRRRKKKKKQKEKKILFLCLVGWFLSVFVKN